jgi:hypothetical protein
LVDAWLHDVDYRKHWELSILFYHQSGPNAGRFNDVLAETVSFYAATQEAEAFAETFNAIRWNPLSALPPVARRFAEILER